MIDKEQLKREAIAFGVTLDVKQLEQFDQYAQILVEWNSRMNLTGITEPPEIVTRHFADSLALLSAVRLPERAKIVDVGAGAGFPSVPIKIARPDLHGVLIDSLGKRITFLEAVSQELEQENKCVHLRAEEAGRQECYREQFDLATARAVAHLRELSEYCLPLVKPGGVFAALKSGEVDEELAEAQRAIKLLGGQVEKVCRFSLADESKRSIVVIKKISQSSTKYPRPHAKMVKIPL